MHQEFCKETALNCSLRTFWKYRPFYLFPPTEREKESWLCKTCQNAHSLLAAINTFRRSQNLPSHKSVSNLYFVICNLYPEFFVKRILITIYLNRKKKSITKTERRKFTIEQQESTKEKV